MVEIDSLVVVLIIIVIVIALIVVIVGCVGRAIILVSVAVPIFVVLIGP